VLTRSNLDYDMDDKTDLLIERAAALVPGLRARAEESEAMRRLSDVTIDEAREAELFQALVPRRWGGHGLGLRAVCEIARVLAHGDASAAWTIAFLIEHNWMACRLPMEAQEEVYADRSFILASAPLVAAGNAERVNGGFEVSGTWRYATGVLNADWTFVTSPVEEQGERIPYTFLVPLSQVAINDDWHVSGMAATSSNSVSAEGMFVPEHLSVETELFHSGDRHPGAVHDEPLYRYPLHPGLNVMMASVLLGAAEAVVEMMRQRLALSKPFGLARLQRAPSRIRWGAAMQRCRAARLLYDDTLRNAIAKGDACEPYEQADLGHLQLACLTVGHIAHEIVSSVCNGMGSSAYQLSDPLQRYRRDVDVLINHAGMDWDVVAERSTRWILGLGRGPHDPHPPRKTPRPVRAG
jgi:3-hydroxy-9,10-secoandrosta-1,3,5(10)-triene-9,17-dione monooxygenase